MCLKPELTSITWQGSLAKKFDSLRENGIFRAYQQIENDQFDRTIEALDIKIEQVKKEIEAILAAIVAMWD